MAMLLVATAVTLAWAPPARAQPSDPMQREMFRRDPPGRHPTHAYRITYYVNSPLQREEDCGTGWLGNPIFGIGGQVASRATCTEVDWSWVGDLFWGILTEGAFNITRTAANVGIWFIERAYAFDIAEWMAEPAGALARRINTTFIGSIGLDDFALFLAVFFSGWQILRRRTRQGLSELAASLLVAVIGAMLIANPTWPLDTAVPYSIAMSGAMLELHSSSPNDGDADDPSARATRGDYDNLVRPLSNELHEAMVGQPYDLINWGEVLTGRCAQAREEILEDNERAFALTSGGDGGISANTHGDEAREKMRDAGCEWNANFNRKSSDARLMMAIVSVIVTVIVNLMLGLIAVVVIGSQLVLAQMLVIAPLAVVFGTVPGTGRQLLARWAGVVLQSLAAIVVMSFVLTLFLELTTTILAAPTHDANGNPTGLNWSNRFFLLAIAVIMLFRARKKLLSLVEEILERAAERLQVKVDEGATDLLSPGNMLRFGMGTAVGQGLVQQASGALFGRWFGRRPPKPGAGGPIGGGPGGPLPGGGGPAGALPAGDGGTTPTSRNQRAGRYGRTGARPSSPAARRSLGFRQMLLQGARLVPGAGRAAATAAAGFGRGAGRAALGTPRGIGRLGAMGMRGAVIGKAGLRAVPRATGSLVRRTPVAVAQGTRTAVEGTWRGTVAAKNATWRGLKRTGQSVNRGYDELDFRVGMAGVRALYGAENSARAVAAGARWTGREIGEGYTESMARPSPLADRLQRYAAGADHQGRHRGPDRHRARVSRPPSGGSAT